MILIETQGIDYLEFFACGQYGITVKRCSYCVRILENSEYFFTIK